MEDTFCFKWLSTALVRIQQDLELEVIIESLSSLAQIQVANQFFLR
jgi:hypothetical protein